MPDGSLTMPQLLKGRELAEHLRISTATVREWTKDGLIPVLRIRSNVLRYSLPDVLAALRKRSEADGAQEGEV
jgi:predicted site-specific integrase-resolvase